MTPVRWCGTPDMDVDLIIQGNPGDIWVPRNSYSYHRLLELGYVVARRTSRRVMMHPTSLRSVERTF